MEQRRSRRAIPIWVWATISAALHSCLVSSPVRGTLETAAPPRRAAVWMTAVPPEPPPEPPAAPPPPAQPPPRVAPRKPAPRARAAATESAATQAPAEPPAGGLPIEGDTGLEIPSGEGGLVAGGEGDGTGRGRGGDGKSDGDGDGEGAREPRRTPGRTELSVAMDLQGLESLALTRPSLGFLLSVPGFREVLRGSGIRPFIDLRRVRVSLGGLAAEQLSVAGVHLGGEQAVRSAAEQIAAMRDREPVWRGDSELRASSWVDGSGVDRGLAVHEGAFVIAPRAAMPALLQGDRPGQRVLALSQLRERVVLALSIEDAARYLPAFEPCALQAVRISIAKSDAGARMVLSALYRTATSARQGRACIADRSASASQLPRLVDWLARAEPAPADGTAPALRGGASDAFGTSLKIGVNNDDIDELLNELAWALRPRA